jgi:Reverse transcriptase (RNA-dependent DNA polymerase)
VSTQVAQLAADAPTTFKQAVTGPDGSQWRASAQKEYDSCVSKDTWDVIPLSQLPSGSNVITVKWVFKRKHDANGVPTEFKARMTPHGYKQIEGVDYYETYAQVGKYKTLRVLLSITAHFDLELEQLDVPSAFLNAELDEDIYMELPDGFKQPGMIVKLKKALYGLKQGPRCWWLLISKFITETLHYTACISDSCFFYKKSRSDQMMYLYLFVDDFQSAFHITDIDEWTELKQLLIDEYQTKELGASVWMLGMRITRNRSDRTIILDQETYITKALEKFDLNECKMATTPESTGVTEATAPEDALDRPVDQLQYMSLVGTALYATTSIRLDAAHALQRRAARVQSPTNRDMIAIKRVFRYFSGSRSVGLKFGGGQHHTDVTVDSFSDADWGNDKVDRKSISGWIVKLNGTPVAWSAKKQSTVALSTCEAELYSLSEVVKEVLWLQGLLNELSLTFTAPSIVHCDNSSTVTISKTGVKTERTKHIDIRHNFITDTVASGVIKTQWISTNDQQADILTKPLPAQVFLKFRAMLMTG